MTSAQRISSGSPFETQAGYSRVVVNGNDVHVSGTTGFNYTTMQIDPDPAAQCWQCFANIAAALGKAGATLDDVVRVRYYLTDAALFPKLAPIFAEAFARARPAATVIVCGLIDPRMALEIEVMARLPERSTSN
jgi:enamine deaminase RidA (YjgF/YER057c/UK114 family)